VAEHAHRLHSIAHVACAVLTVSDTRTEANDASGERIRALLVEAGHAVRHYRIVRDDPAVIGARVAECLDDSAVDAVIVNGGTGLAPRDTTFEAVQRLLEKEIPGFGELFRYLSYAEIGAAAMLSRATAGVARGAIVISLPGAPAAVELAMGKLVLPVLGHMVALVRPGRPAEERA
jgi:molybdenum cofactor biosynthesis protein B